MSVEKQKTILLVEDEVIIAMAEKMTLEKFGHKVITANTGEEAVALVEKTPGIDLILMDINLGAGMDGTEAAALILKDRDLPVVFLSSHAEPEVVEKTEKITSYGYVVKNSSATVLDASIKMAFKLFAAKKKEEEREAALRRSEEKYHTLFREMLDGFALHEIICDADGAPVDYRFLAVNPAFERMTGLKAAQLIGRTVLEVMPGTEQHWIEIYGRVALSGEPALFENHASELKKHFKVTAFQPVAGQFACIFVDITESKLTEEALKKSQLLLQSSIESPKDMIILSIDRQYRYLYFNTFHKDVMAAAYGTAVELGMNLLECITNDDDRIRAKTNYDRALAGENHSTIEEYGDLNRYFYETRYNPIINDKNEVIGATAFSANVTERKQAEQALKESEERFRTLYENSTLGLYRTTPDGRIHLANPALIRMLGYSSFAELAGRNLERSGFAPASDRAHFIETIERDSEVKGLEYAWKRSDETTIAVRESARAIRDARGKTLFYDGIVEDITESKRSERLTATLYGISQAMFTSGDLEELFPRIHALIGDSVPADNFFIALLTDDGKGLSFPYYRDEKDDDEDVIIAADDPRSLTVEVLRTKKPLLLNEAQLQERYASGRNRVWGTAPKCWLGVPLRIRDEAIGVMVIQDYNDSQAYGQKDVMLLESTAGQTAIAIARKRTEKALRESVEAFRGYFNMGTVGISVTSLEKGWIEVNDRLCRMLGYAREELLRLTWAEMTHPDDLNADLDLFNQMLAGQRDSYELEKRFIRKDGRTIHTLLYVSCQRNPDRSIHHFLASLVDISELKRATEALRQSEAHAQALLRSMPDMLFRVDRHGVFLDYRADARALYTQPETPIIGARYRDILPAGPSDLIDRKSRAALETGKLQTFEYQLEMPGRGIRAYEARMAASGADEVTAVIRDITERKQAEAALQKSEMQRRAMLENSPVVILLIQEGKLIYINPAAEIITGWQEEEFIGKNFTSFVHKDDMEIAIKNNRERMGGNSFFAPYVLRIIKKTGGLIYAEINGTVIDLDGKPTMLGFLTDITKRKRAEEEVKRQLAEKEILLKEVHHRIKNNIASIGGLLSLHMQAITSPEAVAALQDAIGRVNSMRLLYEKLLFGGDFRDASVKSYIESLAASVVSLFPDLAKVRLNLVVDDFKLDPKRLFPLGIIINELLTNIMKYAFAGKKSGTIKLSLAKDGSRVTLTLQDNGNGLPEGFDIDQSKGFGLMLVKMLSQQLGGSFSIEKHKGTRCKVEFTI